MVWHLHPMFFVIHVKLAFLYFKHRLPHYSAISFFPNFHTLISHQILNLQFEK